MQAIIRIGSSQFIVEPGQEFLALKAEVDEVLFPQGAKVTVKDMGPVRGEKIRVAKFKAKSRYRKVKGFRATFHKIRVEKVDIREKKV